MTEWNGINSMNNNESCTNKTFPAILIFDRLVFETFNNVITMVEAFTKLNEFY